MITQTVKYALRTLAYLAQQEGDIFFQGRDIAEKLHIPPNYLGKILQKIVRARLVDSQKGFRGGFRAIRPANQISLYDVLLALDGIPRDVALGDSAPADDQLPSTFFDRFENIAQLYTDFLKKTTLADMLAPPGSEPAAEAETRALVEKAAEAMQS